MKVLALVTAKSKSSRIEYKNKVPMYGKPLYKWTIDFLKDNREWFEDLCLSSDRPWDYRLYGGWLMIKRPEYYIRDSTPHIESVRQGLTMSEQITGKKYDAVFLFQPTNPYRTKQMLYHAMAVGEKHLINNDNYMSRCAYIDKNLAKKYLIGAHWGCDKLSEPPMIASGGLYVYSRAYLDNPEELDCLQTMVVPKAQGYNVNNEQDLRIVETFMKAEGVKYGY